MSALDDLNWRKVREQYDVRVRVHEHLLRLHDANQLREFFELATGNSDAAGNYSAAEYSLGPRIRRENLRAEERLFGLASLFRTIRNAHEVPNQIRIANLTYLGIGAGSELSCLLNPDVCWIANTRTIWTDLVIRHADNFERANEELALYRDGMVDSEMSYAIWSEIHGRLDIALTRISEEGNRLATHTGVSPGTIPYLWSDAIANGLYEIHHRRSPRWNSSHYRR